MSLSAYKWVEQQTADINSNCILILYVLAGYTNDKKCDYTVWPSLETIIAKSRLSRSTVIRCIKTLNKLSIISTISQPGRHNTYTLNVQKEVNNGECHDDTPTTQTPVQDDTSITVTPHYAQKQVNQFDTGVTVTRVNGQNNTKPVDKLSTTSVTQTRGGCHSDTRS